MATSLSINTGNSKNQRQVFTLDGIRYIIKTYYNPRILEGEEKTNGSWYISIYDSDENPILTGLKCMPRRNMFKRNPTGKFLNGSLFCVDTDEENPSEDIQLGNFGQGKRFQLWYMTSQDFT
jgi:hypothetical protein